MGLLVSLCRPRKASREKRVVVSRSRPRVQAIDFDLDLAGKRVFIRVDFNVPISGGAVADNTRIRASLPTLRYALEQGAALVLASHLGRPRGHLRTELSLRPIADNLSTLLGVSVRLAADCVGAAARSAVGEMRSGGVVLLENLRFHAEEEQNDAAFAGALAELADVYVNDAFGTAHRTHASTVGIVAHMTHAGVGLLMANELEHLGSLLAAPARPFIAILGGAKVSGKIEVIENLLGRVDTLLIGGAMTYTFLKKHDLPIGSSLVELELLDATSRVERVARESGVVLKLPTDHVVAERPESAAPHETLAVTDTAIGTRMGVDIGPKTCAEYASAIEAARTVMWNGPMGVFEIDEFAGGTLAVAHAVANTEAKTVVGGGDSIAAIAKAGVTGRITHISTGGGASLEFLGGRTLPGVAALPDV